MILAWELNPNGKWAVFNISSEGAIFVCYPSGILEGSAECWDTFHMYFTEFFLGIYIDVLFGNLYVRNTLTRLMPK